MVDVPDLGRFDVFNYFWSSIDGKSAITCSYAVKGGPLTMEASCVNPIGHEKNTTIPRYPQKELC